jgi:uncharacterized protein (UPF0332 family)
LKKDIEYKIRKSNQSINAALVLIENNFHNEAISKIYYACFHISSALLNKYNIDAKTHAGVKAMLHKNFFENSLLPQNQASFYSSIFFFRQTSDYDDNIDYEKEVIISLYNEAIIFISTLNELLTKP